MQYSSPEYFVCKPHSSIAIAPGIVGVGAAAPPAAGIAPGGVIVEGCMLGGIAAAPAAPVSAGGTAVVAVGGGAVGCATGAAAEPAAAGELTGGV